MADWPTHKRKAAARATQAKALKKRNRRLRRRGIEHDND